jgi:hypothetical protein
MRKLFFIGLPVMLIAISAMHWYFNSAEDDAPQTMSALEKTGDECDLISEKAAMHLPEALPFQRLEKAARKARVLENCMRDRAYIENAAWLKHIQVSAQKKADAEQLSFNEAYEALRRKAMYTFKPLLDEPPYWVKSQSAQH